MTSNEIVEELEEWEDVEVSDDVTVRWRGNVEQVVRSDETLKATIVPFDASEKRTVEIKRGSGEWTDPTVHYEDDRVGTVEEIHGLEIFDRDDEVEAIQKFVEAIERGDTEINVIETPMGAKVAPSGEYVRESQCVLREFSDVIEAAVKGDLTPVSDVDDEVWEEFVIIATQAADVDERELRAARES